MKMNTKILMVSSATVTAVLGLGGLFFPQELLTHFGARTGGVEVVLVSVIGALYLGVAGLNWIARDNVIGGIYSRPVAVGNVVHFSIVAIVMLKQLTVTAYVAEFAVGAAINLGFAVGFGYVLLAGGPTSS